MPYATLSPYNSLLDYLKNRNVIVVSNREPFHIHRERNSLRLERTMGGLVSAMDPILHKCNGLWICWDGVQNQEEKYTFEDLCRLAELNNIELPYRLFTIHLTNDEIKRYYYGFANRQIWPLFHYLPSRYAFDERDWEFYVNVNNKFAQAIVDNSTSKDLIWIHDYHLTMVPEKVRNIAPDSNLGFFCHIPFPHYEVFRTLPTRMEILRGILGSDVIGFHTPAYVKYFMDCARILLQEEVELINRNTLIYQGRHIKVDAFPIGIDFEMIDEIAQYPCTVDAVKQLRKSFFPANFIGLGVDRLDYTKGILERLQCIALFFERYPQYRKRLVFVQIAVPSRTEVHEYQHMKQEIDEAVGRINGRFSEDGWAPIHYLYRGFPMDELIVYYQVADFALVNPLRDGMNLVCKEYCAAHPQNDGALILSEMAGAAYQLKESFMVNPYDHPAVVEAIYASLNTAEEDKKRRMHYLRQTIEDNNINKWLSDFLLTFCHVIEHRNDSLA